ncbi:hypothetical protein RD792_008118 [Penstemon davidsonii]|uniref:RecA family profile 2 domain-containing protein n=1 Tax=Penstemon davidsonii TaxID=160366 RepID=A0ABR0D884_9LAMI|nr:hypothetical protein RD792_008118 [Penstemon davidsonii]
MAESINHQVRDSDFARRNANYKANIWNYEHLQSLTNQYDEEKCKREMEALKVEVSSILCAVENPLYYKLELIDEMNKFALSHYFEKDIFEVVNEISCTNSVSLNMNHDPYITALYFRILRQHGHNVSPDAFLCLMDDDEKFIKSAFSDTKTIIEIFEASHLISEDECVVFDKAKTLASKNLTMHYSCTDKINSLKRPLHWSVSWFNVKKRILQAKNDSMLIQLARLSFNIVQVQHQNDLKEILRWWKNLGLSEVLTFARDRVVESFLWAVGVAYEPQHGSLRKWLTKAITLILIIDDVYDIYGSMEELEQFTYAVERWDPKEIQQLPKAIKRCFWLLYDTTNDIDLEIQKEKNWNSVLPHLKRVVRKKLQLVEGSVRADEVTCGGNALKFYAAIRLRISRMALLKTEDKATGLGICVQVVKNKLAPSMAKAELSIKFGKGFCCESEALDLACEHGVIVKEGNNYFIKGKILQSKEEALRFLAANDGALDDIIRTLRCHLFEGQLVDRYR